MNIHRQFVMGTLGAASLSVLAVISLTFLTPDIIAVSQFPTAQVDKVLDSWPAEVPYVAPLQVKGVYVTSATALSKRLDILEKQIKDTELNAIVINVNDTLPLAIDNPKMAEVVTKLNAAGVHTIARVVVFQNEPLVSQHPEWAIKFASGAVWRDGGGHRWIDPASPDATESIINTSKQALAIGFREINFDYIRFPSDGKVSSAVYPYWDKSRSKAEVIEAFAASAQREIKKQYPNRLITIDIFAHTLLVKDDAGIGQSFVNLVDYFDAICPMAYPSHYRAGNFGFANPAAHPYEVVLGTLEQSKKKLVEAHKDATKIRPWLQDFNMGAVYTADMVRQEIKAVHDAGYNDGWLLWNARNVYTQGALLTAGGQ